MSIINEYGFYEINQSDTITLFTIQRNGIRYMRVTVRSQKVLNLVCAICHSCGYAKDTDIIFQKDGTQIFCTDIPLTEINGRNKSMWGLFLHKIVILD
jgi:hypothetical protein